MLLGRRYKYDAKPIIKLNPVQEEVKKEIEGRIKKSRYRMEKVPCAVCGEEEFEKLSEKDMFGLPVSVVICRKCGLIQTNPRLTQDSYKEFYEKEHTRLVFGEKKPTKEIFLDEYFHGQKIYKYIKRYLPKNLRGFVVLEVGCGAGGILAYFKDLGAEMLGCDLDPECVELGRSIYGLNIFRGTLSDLKIKKKPNLIIMSHILEHLLFPSKELSLIRDLLEPKGFLYIEVPGVRNMTFIHNDMNFLRFLQIAHTYHFSLTTLNNLLGRSGFELIEGDEKIRSLFRLSKNKQFKIVNDYQRQITYLKRIEFLRRVFPLTPFKIRYAIETLFEKIFKILKVYNLMRFFYRKLIERYLPKKYD